MNNFIKSDILKTKIQKEYVNINGREFPFLIPVKKIKINENIIPEEIKNKCLSKTPEYYIYDTAGPYESIEALTNFQIGIPKIREEWMKLREQVQSIQKGNKTIRKGKHGERVTQRYYAKKGIITPEMEYVAYRESIEITQNKIWVEWLWKEKSKEIIEKAVISPEWICKQVAEGKIIIPANINHLELEPMGIGQGLRTKINANIGNSSIRSGIKEEIEKMIWAVMCGADTVMDLSTGEEIESIREAIIRNSPVPIGTVPIYEVLEKAGGNPEDISWELYRDILIQQAEQGVDYFTIHAGLLEKHLPLVEKRLAGIVSRGGAIIARWMKKHKQENFTYTHWNEICEILATYDVAVSIGDGLRPGCIYDANDEAQFAELKIQSELAKRAGNFDVQVMHEGPGHIPMNKILDNIEIQKDLCNSAPFYTLGPVVTDIATGYDHISSAIGATLIGSAGTAMLCYVTPKEHIGLPDREDVREGVITYRISAHASDIAKGLPSAFLRDCLMALARVKFSWEDQFALALDPEKSLKMFMESNPCIKENGKDKINQNYCTMCGPKFCAMKLSKTNE
ncbi:MAG TPA: phosphomethylpyrimidine synthase ThiC [Candidatus Hydrogenedens sp.]|nr:phosphomethylpyrimidine synthase ThiC [Candidatus Hydrogenedens sp.]